MDKFLCLLSLMPIQISHLQIIFSEHIISMQLIVIFIRNGFAQQTVNRNGFIV